MHEVIIGNYEEYESDLEPFEIPTIFHGNPTSNIWKYFETWCIKNCSGRYKMISCSDVFCIMGFEFVEDAIAFKLRWT